MDIFNELIAKSIDFFWFMEYYIMDMENSSKKVIAKDIAREAGVSEATVSYIINDRKDVKISDVTRKKVLQLCNLMQYAPSQTAKSLATGKNNIIGIQFNILPQSPSRNLQIMRLLTKLQFELQLLNYDTLIMPSIQDPANIRIQRNIDGIICVDLPENQFYTLKENYFVPIISVDMVVNDPIFFSVHNNFYSILDYGKKLLRSSRICFITEQFQNIALMQDIQNATKNDTLFTPTNVQELQTFLTEHKDEYFIVFDEFLAQFCFNLIPQNKIAVLCDNNASQNNSDLANQIVIPLEKKVEMIVNSLICAIQRNTAAIHETILSPQ